MKLIIGMPHPPATWFYSLFSLYRNMVTFVQLGGSLGMPLWAQTQQRAGNGLKVCKAIWSEVYSLQLAGVLSYSCRQCFHSICQSKFHTFASVHLYFTVCTYFSIFSIFRDQYKGEGNAVHEVISSVLHVTNVNTFASHIATSDLTVVDYWAPWCKWVNSIDCSKPIKRLLIEAFHVALSTEKLHVAMSHVMSLQR